MTMEIVRGYVLMYCCNIFLYVFVDLIYLLFGVSVSVELHDVPIL